jgi:NADH-quinone oxidoreductase subunit E
MNSVLSEGLKDRIAKLAARYPVRSAALLPALHGVQAELGWISPAAEAEVAGILEIRPIEVRETVTFYGMFRRRPAGRHQLRVCRNLSCALRGSEAVLERLKLRLGIGPGQTTPDGRITLTEVECLGNCANAPCLMIDFEEHGRVDPETVDRLLEKMDPA